MICILHGYLLDGSGSNVWTRAMAQALCRVGQDIHLVCQEPHPEAFDFITAAHVYDTDGSRKTIFERDTPYRASCVMHKPRLGNMLPVYVSTPDRYEEFSNVVPMVKLSDDEIETYLTHNVAAVTSVVQEHGITSILANHAVLMSVVAERVSVSTGVPFAIMPHGSAIEYVVKKDQRYRSLAASAFRRATRLFVQGDEMRQRIIETFPEQNDIEQKIETINLGVDTGVFGLIDHKDRRGNITALNTGLVDRKRGMPPDILNQQRKRFHADIDRQTLSSILAAMREYTTKLPDADIEKKLACIDWEKDLVLLFVGRLISSKGLQSIVAALPQILATHPNVRLIVTGHGPLRPVMEALLWALENDADGLVRNIAKWGDELTGGPKKPFEEVCLFLEALESRGELSNYFETAGKVISPERVVFTGYLTHSELKYLMPCCDVAIFPSIVPEAGPLVLLEALACGCFPLGTYFAGMAAHIDSVANSLPSEDADFMRLSNDTSQTVADIVANSQAALALGGVHKKTLRRAVEELYDWTTAARRLSLELNALNA